MYKLISDSNIIDEHEETLVILCHIIFLSFCLYFLKNRPLWNDEIITIITVRRPFIDGLLQLQDYSAPLYQLILRLVVNSDYPPEWLIRAPAIFFGIMGLLTSWLFARKIFGKKVALMTIFLLTVNPVFIYYSTEGRPYSLFLFLTVLSMLTFYNLLCRLTAKNAVVYVISSVFLLYSHFFGIFTIIGQLSYLIVDLLITRKKFANFKLIFLSIGCVVIFYLPILFLMSRYIYYGAQGAAGWIPKPSLAAFCNIRPLFDSSIVNIYFMLSLLIVIWRQPFNFDGRHFVLGRARDIGFSIWWNTRSNTLFIFFWILFNFSIVILISVTIKTVYVTRYFLPSVVPITILIGLSINRIKGKLKCGLFLFLGIILINNAYNKHIVPITKYHQLVNYLSDNDNNQTAIYVIDFPYCDNYVNQQVRGLRYYGFTKNNLNLLKIYNPYNISINEPEKLPVNKRLLIVCIRAYDRIEEYFDSQPRAHRIISFGTVSVIEVEKQGYSSYWPSASLKY